MTRSMLGVQFSHPRLEALARHHAHFQTERAQNASDAEFHFEQFAEQKLTPDKQRPDFL